MNEAEHISPFAGSGHQSPGLWRHPKDQSHRFNELEYWQDLAKLLEKGKFHGMFIADVLGGYDVYKGPQNLEPVQVSGAQWPVNEPLQVVPAMAGVTKNLGFGVTIATTYEQPYHLARRISTADHLTKGRLAWNIVTGYLDSAARNLGHTAQPDHAERYAAADEYIEVIYKLLESSWRDDAVVRDAKRGVYTEPSRVRKINHVGKHYNVPGPHICQPSPQRTPVLCQAGTSKSGQAFSSKNAEIVFVAGHSPSVIKKNVAAIRQQAADIGRDPQNVKFLTMLCPILGRTQEEAEAKYEEYTNLASVDGALALFGGWTGIDLDAYDDDQELRHVESNAIKSAVEGWSKSLPGVAKWTKHTVAKHIGVGGLGATVVGTAEKVADELERWVAEADVDGFNIVSSHRVSIFMLLCFLNVVSSRDSDFNRRIPSHPAALKMSSSCWFRNYKSVASSMMIMRSMVVHTARTSIRGRASLVCCPITLRHTIDGVPPKKIL